MTTSGPLIVQISGSISGLDNSSGQNVSPYKTITGTGSKPTVDQCIRLYPSDHIIVQNLNIMQTTSEANAGSGGNDGITIKNGAHDIWVDHCTFTDCADGEIDVTYQSDYVTISWCKFQYTFDHTHDFVNLIGADDSDPDAGFLHVTVHHNWYANLCKERMPRVRFGPVHVFNNYYGAAGNNYDIGVGNNCNIRVESNYFDSQTDAWKDYRTNGQGIIGWNSDNQFINTAIPTWISNSYSNGTFTPPYSYTLDSGANVKNIVTSGAGCPL